MSAPKTPSLGVNNVLSFNGHGGKASTTSFTLDLNSNVYILVPFGLDVELPTGQTKTKTDTTFKGLDVCYTSFSPGSGSFEEIIYSKDGKLKLVFNDKNPHHLKMLMQNGIYINLEMWFLMLIILHGKRVTLVPLMLRHVKKFQISMILLSLRL